MQSNMKKERKIIPVELIDANTGQLGWLPRNPRQWTQSDIDATAHSIEEDPDFLEERPILVVEDGTGRYVAFAGNLRREGCAVLYRKDAPCVIYTPENDADHETVKRRALKDNGSFGAWDYDELANNWDDLPLADWGVPAWNMGGNDKGEKEKSGKESGEKSRGEDNATYAVRVTCETLKEQLELIGRLTEEGYECGACE